MATVKAKEHFDSESTSKEFHRILQHGGFFGANELELVELIASLSNAQRLQVAREYKALFGKDLIDQLKSKLSFNFESLVVGLMTSPLEYDALCLRNAMKGIGTDEATLIEILTTRSNDRIKALRAYFHEHYHHDLEHDLKSESSGKFKHLLVSLCQGERDEGVIIDPPRALADARALYKAGEGSWLTQGSEFNRVFMTSNPAQLRAVAAAYEEVSKISLEAALHKELHGDIKDAVLAMLHEAFSVHQFFADKLYHSMKGLGTDDRTLIRIVVTRSEVDMVNIKEAFRFKYGKTLGKMIAGDTSGAYRDLLLAIVDETDSLS